MAKQGFDVGDIVQLKSGGPEMTVCKEHSNQYQCQWFAGKKLENGWFPENSLKKVEEQKT